MNITNDASTTTKTSDLNESNLELTKKTTTLLSRQAQKPAWMWDPSVATTKEEANNRKDLGDSKLQMLLSCFLFS